MTTVAATTRRKKEVPKHLRDDGNGVVASKGTMVPRDAAAASFTTKRARPFMLIDPRYSKFAQNWDICTMMALIFTAIITPFEVAFLSSPVNWDAAWVSPLFLINRLVDIIFTIDLVLQFFLIYPEQNDASGVKWVESRRHIAAHYLKSWFALDFFSILLVIIDFISVDSGDDPTVNIQALRVLRVLRALRLIKLVRLVRASRMFKRWECRIAINYGALALGRCVVGVLVLSHWFACLFALQTIFFDSPVQSVLVIGSDPPEYVDTWKGNFNYCTATGATLADGSAEAECLDPWALYCVSVYWAIMTITSIGYGDIGASPRNSAEQIFTAIMMLAGGFLWGQVIGTFCGVIATFDPHGAEFRRNMDDLNIFMAQKHLPVEMRHRLREYFHQTKHLQMANSQRHLFHMMSPALQGEVAWTANEEWLKRIPFMLHCGEDFKVEVAMALTPKVFAPGEVAPKGYLYVINRGLALYGARVLTAGKIWGDDVVMYNSEFHSPYNARAMNYLEVYTISRDRLFELAEDYPLSKKAMRREALYMAMRRALHELVVETKKGNHWKTHGRLSFAMAGLKNKLVISTDTLNVFQKGGQARVEGQATVSPVRQTGSPAKAEAVGKERGDGLLRMCEELQREQREQREQLTRVLQLLEAQAGARPTPAHPAAMGGGGSTPARSAAGSSTASEVGGSGRRRRSHSSTANLLDQHTAAPVSAPAPSLTSLASMFAPASPAIAVPTTSLAPADVTSATSAATALATSLAPADSAHAGRPPANGESRASLAI